MANNAGINRNSEDERIERIAREVAPIIIKEALERLGFETNNLSAMQADMLYLRKIRIGTEMFRSRVFLTVIATTIPAFMYIFWESIKNAIRG